MTIMQMVGLMPLRISKSRLDRDFSDEIDRSVIAIETYNRFMRSTVPFRLFVVVPQSDYRIIKTKFDNSAYENVQIDVCDEATLLGTKLSEADDVSGSIKQQLIKLAFSEVCPSKNYLTLDSDVFLNKPCEISALEPEGLGLIQLEPVSVHLKWWEAVVQLLGGNLDYDQGMSVTPAVMSAEGCKLLLKILGERGSSDWRDQLIEARKSGCYWTEYTLYYHFLKKEKLLDIYHDMSPRNRLYGPSVWRAGRIQSWSLELAQKTDGWFSVLQSSAGISINELRSCLRSILS